MPALSTISTLYLTSKLQKANLRSDVGIVGIVGGLSSTLVAKPVSLSEIRQLIPARLMVSTAQDRAQHFVQDGANDGRQIQSRSRLCGSFRLVTSLMGMDDGNRWMFQLAFPETGTCF